VVVAVTTAVLVGPAVELGGVEAGTGCAAAQGGVQAGLVVDYGTVDGGPGVIAVECEELPAGSTGADLLVALGHELRFNSAGLLCGIDDYPKTGCGQTTDGGYRFWSYWRASPGSGSWTYASIGPAAARLSDGAIEGWRFVEAPANPSAPQPRQAPVLDQVCAEPAPPTTPAPTTPPPTAPPVTSPPPTAPPPPGGAPDGGGDQPGPASPDGSPTPPPDAAGPGATATPGDPTRVPPADPGAPGAEGDAAADGTPMEVRPEDGLDLAELVARGTDGSDPADAEMALERAGEGGSGGELLGVLVAVALIAGIGVAAAVGLGRRSRGSP
jgi:hypothetical protein